MEVGALKHTVSVDHGVKQVSTSEAAFMHVGNSRRLLQSVSVGSPLCPWAIAITFSADHWSAPILALSTRLVRSSSRQTIKKNEYGAEIERARLGDFWQGWCFTQPE